MPGSACSPAAHDKELFVVNNMRLADPDLPLPSRAVRAMRPAGQADLS